MERKSSFWMDEIARAFTIAEAMPQIIKQLENKEITIEKIGHDNLLMTLKAMNDALCIARNESDKLRRDLQELKEREESWEDEIARQWDEERGNRYE